MLKIKEKFLIYLRLMRLDKPIGILLLLWPTWCALWVASGGLPDMLILIVFTSGVVLMRSVGCVINDIADREFDGAVERTKDRPFAQKQVSVKEAICLALSLSFLAALCLLPLNYMTWLMSVPALFLACSYPFTKRFFPIPQLYLGVAFSFGIPMAFTAVNGVVPMVAWLIFTANLFWTLAYDTIYAMVDKEDDLKIGIKTSAITFGRYDVLAVMLSHFVFDVLLLILGINLQATFLYWLALALIAYCQYKQYRMIRYGERHLCFEAFLSNNWIGLLVFLGLVFHYIWN